uniref:Uncharacterized protein n=1 Tax=Sinocyclocheilus grahami TaxID=75366 RepID=A0A672M9R2_SINGR
LQSIYVNKVSVLMIKASGHIPLSLSMSYRSVTPTDSPLYRPSPQIFITLVCLPTFELLSNWQITFSSPSFRVWLPEFVT